MSVVRGRTRLTAVLAVAVLAATIFAGSGVGKARAQGSAATAAAVPCTNRVLVLGAMPLEINPLVRAGSFDPNATKRIDGRTFYFGRLAGNDVVLAMTGIGPANAGETTALALDKLGCTFSSAVFSGVAGSKENIGDVTVPARWTLDNGKTFTAADPAMLAVAQPLAGTGNVKGLSQDVPVGDAACLCPGVDAATPVHMPQAPKVVIGGDGETSDPFGGHAVPCAPGGGDVAGCEPCLTIEGVPYNAATFASKAGIIADPTFWMALFQTQTATTASYEAQDEETAVVAKLTAAKGVPFLGFRAVSDGSNDPLHLPGFPVQFFVYRQLAGNNAAAVTIAFLQAWAAPPLPLQPALR
jgi:nucleoside phosphorylase